MLKYNSKISKKAKRELNSLKRVRFEMNLGTRDMKDAKHPTRAMRKDMFIKNEC